MKTKDKIFTSVIAVVFVILLSVFWNIFVPINQDVIRVYEKQIKTAQDNTYAELDDNIVVSTSTKEESNNEYTIITTKASAEMVKLEGTYNENGEIMMLNFSCSLIWSRLSALLLSAVISFIVSLMGLLLFE